MSDDHTPVSATPRGSSGVDARVARVSVIIPVYRFGSYSEQAVESVLAQTRPPLEVIVVDDGSPNRDGVEHLRARFGDRIRLVSRENGGPAAARNTGLKAARAPLIAFLDEDDLWEPTFLDDQLRYLESRRDVALVCADAYVFGNPEIEGRLLTEMLPTDGEPSLENLLAQRCHVVMSSVVGHRDAFERVGLFDERRSFVSAEDYDLWLRLAHSGARIAFHRKPLIHRRVHDENLTRENWRLAVTVVAVLEQFAAKYPLGPSERRAVDATLRALRSEIAIERCKASLARGDFAGARRESAAVDRSRLGWKGQLALIGLLVLPRLVGAVYRARERGRGTGAQQSTRSARGDHTHVGSRTMAAATPVDHRADGSKSNTAVAEVVQ